MAAPGGPSAGDRPGWPGPAPARIRSGQAKQPALDHDRRGTDHGEGTAQAALRELWEESGIKAIGDELIGPVWQRTTEFSFAGTRYRQEEDYYVLRVGEVQVTLANLDPIERATITSYRWWSREELTATTEAFFPAELPELLRQATDAS
jgi:8-oxo-dGTP pyrophosphatase MutT (NUDIX family)